MPRPLCLVTGASAGIGAALAAVYARNGHDLVLVARRQERLEQLAARLRERHGVAAEIIVADLSAQDAVGRLASRLAEAGLEPDVLVNNAGFALPGRFLDAGWAEQREVLLVLLERPAELVHAFAPSMVRRRRGRILNVASVAGLVPGGGGQTLYPATKAALIRFSQGLHVELAGAGVHVTALCPGFTHTEFHDRNDTRRHMGAIPPWLWLNADAVAEAGFAAVERNEPICVPGRAWQLIVAATRLMPESLALKALRRHARRIGRG